MVLLQRDPDAAADDLHSRSSPPGRGTLAGRKSPPLAASGKLGLRGGLAAAEPSSGWDATATFEAELTTARSDLREEMALCTREVTQCDSRKCDSQMHRCVVR